MSRNLPDASPGLPATLLAIRRIRREDPALNGGPGRRGGARSALALGLLALLLGAPAEAYTTAAAGVTNGLFWAQNPFDRNSQRKVARDSAGACFVVFTQTTTDREVRLARSADCSTSWQQLVLFASATAGQEFLFPSIDVSDDRKTIHVVALATSPLAVVHSQNASLGSGGWSTVDNWTRAGGIDATPGAVDYDSITTTLAQAPSVAVDPQGRPHVVYVDVDGSSRPNVFHTLYNGGWTAAVNLSQVTGTGTLPQDLDPSIDCANGYLHVLYKDDSFPNDGTARTDRYQYVRNVSPGGYATFNAPATVIAQGTLLARPGSLAAYGSRVFVVGGYSSGSGYGWRNSSADDGATWADGATGAAFETSLLTYSPVVGLNPAGSDHRVVAMRTDGSQEIYRYRWNGTTWASRTNNVTESGSNGADLLHVSIEKHKPARAANTVYCWYKSGASYDNIYCSLDIQGMTQSPRAYLRSIGTAANYTAGNVTIAAVGDTTVTGSGTAWKTANRGRGDRITIGANTYAVLRVDSNTRLTLASPAVATASGAAYTIGRQYRTLQEWENCISYATPTSCSYFQVNSASLVADDRSEIGIAYEDSVFAHSNGGPGGAALPAGSPILSIDGPADNTDASHTITLTADGTNRHYGLPGTGVVLDNEADAGNGAVFLFDDHVGLEWMEVRGGTGATAHGVVIGSPAAANQIDIRYNLIHDVGGNGIDVYQARNVNLLVTSSILYRTGGHGIDLDPLPASWSGASVVRLFNNTLYGTTGTGIYGSTSSFNVDLRNNIAHGCTGGGFSFPDGGDADAFPDVAPTGSNNLSGSIDGSAGPHSPTGGGWPNISFGQVAFVNTAVDNYHIQVGSYAQGRGADLGALVASFDVDAQARSAPWDVGADEVDGSTAVSLLWFEGVGVDGGVELLWRTGAEVHNLGFHVWRSPSGSGPWTRLTGSLIPGQGFAPMGAAYAWRDSGLQNGTRYFYRLEDVDTRSVSSFHGPVSAVPGAAPPPADGGGGGTGEGGSGPDGPSLPGSACPGWALARLGSSAYTCETHGDPFASSFRVLSRSDRSAVVEFATGGFLAARDASGRVRALVPGFDSLDDPTAPALPLRRVLLDGVVGRRARILSVLDAETRSFPGLLPAAVGYPQAVTSPDGTVRPGRRDAPPPSPSRGLLPRDLARLAGEGFLGEEKTLVLELTPLRFDASRSALVLARRLTVRIDFAERDVQETGQGRLGRRRPRSLPSSGACAFLATSREGLHAVPFEALFPDRPRAFPVDRLRLSRDQGRTLVPFHVLPDSPLFGPGSRLLFHVDATAPSTSFSPEVVYALERGAGGLRMGLRPASPDGSAPVSSRGSARWETNRIYSPDVLDIEDLWQWEYLGSRAGTTKPFSLDGLDPVSLGPVRLAVFLQGGSDAASVVDHHVQVFVNDALVAEASFDGAVPRRLDAEVPLALLREADNQLRVLNVGDTGVASRVFLDRFEVLYPQASALRNGLFDGLFSSPGIAEVAGLPSPAALLDLTASAWLTGFDSGPSLRFRVEADHRYLAVSEHALLAPRVFFPGPSRLRGTAVQADYILVAPRAFLPAAQPLLDRRQSQGLSTFAASLEEIASSFGAGQLSAEAIKDFLSFAYHRWQRPSPRYVLLLGDASYDPRRFIPTTSQPSPTPFLLHKTSYLWTVSDPLLAAVNGDDPLPDLALGRLPATTVEQARAMVAKILDWEDLGHDLDGNVALVADNPDLAGDFEADQLDIQASFLAGRDVTRVFLGQIGNRDTARRQILDAFDSGLSLVSYVGHGGGAVWASENILSSFDTPSLLGQTRQPLMLTLNCLNGYFIAPVHDSLAEAFLKAGARGTIAAFSPSGLSLDGPAHLFHRAFVHQLTSNSHQRLGDAFLAAQHEYATTGVMPELLAVYHLLADPALRTR